MGQRYLSVLLGSCEQTSRKRKSDSQRPLVLRLLREHVGRKQRASRKFLRNERCRSRLCFVAAVLTFFIAGLLYLLCFEHVDNLGAYSFPPETGLLIPSGYNS